MTRVFNFGAGPAALPLEVLEQAQAELLDFNGAGMSVLECSHRGKQYEAVHNEAVAAARRLLKLTDDYAVLFLQGGASLQFAMVPMNLLPPGRTADYTNSGAWGAKAIKEAARIGTVQVVADCGKEIPTRVPRPDELRLTSGAAYVHITSNETISGAQWKEFPRTEAPLVADMSSDILSRPFDATQFGLIYAGAQKNLGPSGVTLVAIRKDLAARAPAALPVMLRYQTHIEENSLYNTPPCFAVYLMALVLRWVEKTGLENLYRRNREKAAQLYAAIDAGGFYRGTARPECRSDMNVTFRLPTEALEESFAKEADQQGLKGLKGHRSVGGIRASIYNACPLEAVAALVDFMRDFERRNG
jgi:phosphoserine aminotransferase